MAYPEDEASAKGFGPWISKITLPSGNTYTLKDPVAWDGTITGSLQQQIDQLSQQIAGGVSFIIAWDGSATPVVANIPAGVKVKYNGTEYTGTMSADSAQPGAFYLVKSSSDAGQSDVYDEYFPVGQTGSKTWEKIGDTQIDLSDIVTDVTLNQSTTNFLTGLGTASTSNVIGENATIKINSVTVTVAESTSSGDVQVVKDGTTTYYKFNATGANTAWNNKDNVAAVTGFDGDPTTDTFVKSVSAETGKNLVTSTVAGSNAITGVTDNTSNLVTASAITSITANTSKLATTTIYGVGATTVNAVNLSSTTNQTTATGSWTIITPPSENDANNNNNPDINENLLANIRVTSETLIFSAASLTTQSTSQYAFDTVAVPVKNSNSTTVATGSLSTTGGSTVATGLAAPTTAAFATGALAANGSGATIMTSTTKTSAKFISASTITFATGETSTTGSGAAVVTGVTIGTTASAITALPGFTTKSAIGSAATFTVTQPTIALSSSNTATTGYNAFLTAVTKTYLSATGSASVGWSNKATVSAVTGYASPTSSAGLNTGTSITVTKGS